MKQIKDEHWKYWEVADLITEIMVRLEIIRNMEFKHSVDELDSLYDDLEQNIREYNELHEALDE